MRKSITKILKFCALFAAIGLALFLLPGILFIGTSIYYLGEDYSLQPVWEDGFSSASKVLESHGLCKLGYACAEQQVAVYVRPHAIRHQPKGFDIEIYGTADQELLKQLSQPFINEFNQTPSIEQVTIRAYKESRTQAGNIIPYISDHRTRVLNITLKRSL